MISDTLVEPLFRPIKIGSLEMPNRLAMAPMTRSSSPHNTPDQEVAAYYRRRAAGGTGLLVTEGVGIDHPAAIGADSGASDRIPILHGAQALAGWKAVLDQVHQAGGRIFPQLWHQGPFKADGTGLVPDAPALRPSGLWGPDNGFSTVSAEFRSRVLSPTKPMTEEEIADAVAAFARSAANAKKLGFDGIALHGASGYLIDSFLWPLTNRRTDRYGGDAQGRARFGAEVVTAVRQAIGPKMPIVFRFGQWKQQDFNARIAHTPDELGLMLQAIADAGTDLFDASTLYYGVPAFSGSDLSLAGWAKKLTGKPSMAVGGVGLSASLYESFETGGASVERNYYDVAERIDRGEFDMIALGRALIADADWATKVRTGERTLPYRRDMLDRIY